MVPRPCNALGRLHSESEPEPPSPSPVAETRRIWPLALVALLLVATPVAAQSFVNFETPHVHPLDRVGDRLLAVNTADNRLEVFDISSGAPVSVGAVPVGLDPVSVRALDANTAWVVNHISDSVSVVDLTTLNVIATVPTRDEPCDVVFAGSPLRAFVSCSQVNAVQVFDPSDLTVPPTTVDIVGEDPRALAVSADGSTVYAAIFESGNGTTILGGGQLASGTLGFPPNVVSDPTGPYGGQNPPPNDGAGFEPALNPVLPGGGLPVGLIVRRNELGLWWDDNGGDWTELVSGSEAARSGRMPGWDLWDHDVAVIDANSLSVSYVDRLMNLCMGLAVHPVTGEVTLVGTDALNEVRFEPNLNGVFLRVLLAQADPTGGAAPAIVDLNPHLDYTESTVAPALRDQSLGDPRAIVWAPSGDRAFVAGLGSNNVVVIDATGARVGSPIEVGEGPTGLVLDATGTTLYVLNKFSATVTTIDVASATATSDVAFYDPTPAAIRDGRFALYDTHGTSGTGHVSCGSCHADARLDRLAWDLGDPSGDMQPFTGNCFTVPGLGGCDDFHPMKGPMTTQTLQDIIGKEPLHWRGDRNGIEDFNPAFVALLGAPSELTAFEMQQFEDFLATIHYPPNPYREFDNSLPTNLPLDGHYSTGRFNPATEGDPLPNGNAQSGLSFYRNSFLDAPFQCVTCHTLPTGAGPDFAIVGLGLQPVPVGPMGEHHLGVVGVDGSTNISIKIPHLRNLYEKTGFEMTQLRNTVGFGFLHDGSVDSLSRFLTEPAFSVVSDQQVADLVAFMLAFSGSDLPQGSVSTILEPPGVPSRDAHAAVGTQLTFDAVTRTDPLAIALYGEMMLLADQGDVGLVAKGRQAGLARGYRYGGGQWQSDRASEAVTATALRLAADTGSEITITVVPSGSQTRIGIDRDLDGAYDRDELDVCADPADPTSTPATSSCGEQFVRADCNADGQIDISDPVTLLESLFAGGAPPPCDDACDANDDGAPNIADVVFILTYNFSGGVDPSAPFPTCGADPTADGLGCGAFAACP